MKRGWALAFGLAWGVHGSSSAQSTTGEQGDQAEHDDEAQRPAPPPRSLPAVETLPERDGMVRLPRGRLRYDGARSRATAGTKDAVREIVIDAFYLDRTEVTVGAYAACVRGGRCTAPERSSPFCSFGMGDERLPVSCVRHGAAASYCRERGARLPTEAEWEYAAKGQTERVFPWGDARATCAIAATLRSDHTAKSCTGGGPAPVGTHPLGRSPFGIDDLAGNLEEWTADYWSEPRPAVPPRSGASHVLRGGSWLLGPSYARTTTRSSGSPLESGPGVGFRCAKAAE